MAGSDGLRDILRAQALPSPGQAAATALAARLAEAGGRSVQAILFFGSHKSGAAPSPESAYDFFLVVSEYAEFYRSLARAGLGFGNPALASFLNVFLPPNLIFADFEAEGVRRPVKAAVISIRAFERETTGARRDHFLTARLFQSVEIVFFRNGRIRDLVLDALTGVARKTTAWGRPDLPPSFTLEDFLRTLFWISFSAEIKPEGAERGESLYFARKHDLDRVYERVLIEAVGRGDVQLFGSGRYGFSAPATAGERRRWRFFFVRSKIRATARWPKYRWTFSGWRDYLARKIERRGGPELLAILKEKKRPMIFLWPRIYRFLRLRRKKETGGGIRGVSS